MSVRSVQLTDHFDRFVDEKVRQGRFEDASEVVRAGLHLLEQQEREAEERLAQLRRLVAEGVSDLESGRRIVVEGDEALRLLVRNAGQRAAERVSNIATQ